MLAEGMNKPGTVRDAGIEPKTGQMQPQPSGSPQLTKGDRPPNHKIMVRAYKGGRLSLCRQGALLYLIFIFLSHVSTRSVVR